jgi:hypothetical protein
VVPVYLFAQTTVVLDAPVVNGTTVVIPGKEFKRSGYHNFWWGKHYRTEWNTAARFPNFYIDTALGGLTPYAPGGGRQSKTLRLRSKSGGEYVLRSIHKDLGRAMPDATRGTVINKMARDQSSMAHPYAAITITPMAEAAGVYHTVPRIVFVPIQAALGEYNADYGDQLYLFEQRPDENEEDAPNFGNSKNVIGTDKLFENFYKDNDNHVDQEAYVRARLFDMFLGDWGRHVDNWRWAKFDEGKDNIYRPIPRDRDQAYTRLDGFYPSIAGMVYKPLQGFDDRIKNVPDWNRHASRLDMLFLTDLEKDEWIKQAKFLQTVLTDQLIESSIKLLPQEVYSMSGEDITSKLKERRDRLEKFAIEYYDFLAKHVDIVGSHDREFFCVNRLPNNETEVCIYKITKENKLRDQPYFSRVFKPGETKEIRIYSLESADKIEIRGENKGILVRVIDPEGKDSVTFVKEGLHPDLKEEQHYHSSKVRISAGRKYEYDTLHEKKLDVSIRPVISSSHYKTFDNDPLKLFPRTGIKVLASLTYKPQPWKKLVHERIHHLCANYGIFRGAFNIGYVGRLTRLFGKWDLMVRARIDAPAVENYFGTGNETKIENTTTNYYRTYSQRVYGSLGIERDFAKYHHAEIFAFYQSVKVYRSNDHFTSEPTHLIDPDVFNRNQYAGVEAGYTFEKSNDRFAPTRGFGFTLGTGYFRNIKGDNDDFFKVLSSVYAYIPLGKQFSIASRVGGGTISGDAPYYYLNTVGGGGSGEIRGYDRERFYGKHSLHFNNDLRWIFPTRNFLFSGKAGLIGFYDIGRVWVPGEVSDLWHNSYGGGILLVPYNKFAISATYGVSTEGSYVHFKAGLFF